MSSKQKTLYIIRHGETGSNVDGRFQHNTEPLTKRGEAQAEALAARLAREHMRYPITKLITSTDDRAVQTAGAIGGAIGLAPTHSPLFVERRHPSVIRGKLTTDPGASIIHMEGRDHFHDPDFIYGDGETFSMMKARALAGITYLLALPDEHIALVTHGVFATFFVAATQRGESLTSHDLNAYQFRFDNTGFSILTHKVRTNFSETGEGWVILRLNDTAHLT
ncbi:MAG: hypothetical protein A2845_00535 [Candidatus Lloydbacteria bacterium RIFCSPHIGHO2_01_FULL_49_22]|uniref:Phosphoglycerate mutase n=1 Tax=Candidatus Lloydbacteria bacterium RIFCSPHIGHO2_01_FULL_49_22 TaxID=1798658 RepID=A0A1G2CY14_9BACT|nr:MAG: hypothetical protein A2845_00535 [Candidatus Lloydbacteria bacterium RIFCSPHIGHO2_01_FULL_49_22]OGZ09350.1 MAG: hypothetical protein A3C14_05440 [Candidatus Lloydbacteria bacterium RIFCSPHIGHO2_02_FULL_50_18]